MWLLKKYVHYKIPLLSFTVTRAYPLYFLSFSSRRLPTVLPVPTAKGFLIFPSSQQQGDICAAPYASVSSRGEEEGGGDSVAVTSFLRDMLLHQFSARIVVQFENGKSLDLNECYGDFLITFGSVWHCLQLRDLVLLTPYKRQEINRHCRVWKTLSWPGDQNQ